MKILIPGGSGQIGEMLVRYFTATGDEVVVLSRSAEQNESRWDGRTLSEWTKHIDSADVVINLAGRTVNCRYSEPNLRQMMDSRVDSTRVVGQAIEQAQTPPKVWLQMSTATIYADRRDAANDEQSGIIGGNELNVPAYWKRSIDIAQAWENELTVANTPNTRKVALRTAMVMSPNKGGVFSMFSKLTRLGLGGAIAGGQQYVSWIHEADFVNAIRFLIDRDDLDGAINLTSPNPLPQHEFQRVLRTSMDIPIGLPATKWMAEIGAFFLRTDTELILKSRRVVPGRLLNAGFRFQFPDWEQASKNLLTKYRGPASGEFLTALTESPECHSKPLNCADADPMSSRAEA